MNDTRTKILNLPNIEIDEESLDNITMVNSIEFISEEENKKIFERVKDGLKNISNPDRWLTREECELLAMPMAGPCAVLLNKEDAGEHTSMAGIERLTQHRPILPLSAQTGEGLDGVKMWLKGFLRKPSELMLTHERHMSVARQALERLVQARTGLAYEQPLDLAAVDLHEALYLLGRITGDSVDEQLLDDIFSRFCVGK